MLLHKVLFACRDLDMDDYDGICGEGRFALISTASRILKGSQSQKTTLKPNTVRPSVKFSCPSPSGFFKNPSDCTKFYQCSNWYPYQFSCPSGLRYNANILNCDWASNVSC